LLLFSKFVIFDFQLQRFNFLNPKSKCHTPLGTIIDNKTSGETTFLEKGLKTVRTFSGNTQNVSRLPLIKSKNIFIFIHLTQMIVTLKIVLLACAVLFTLGILEIVC